MAEIAETAELLISTITSENLDQISAFKILDEHADCFVAELCPICSYLEDESLGDVLHLMARNPSITRDVQKRILEESFKWQGAESPRDYQLHSALPWDHPMPKRNLRLPCLESS